MAAGISQAAQIEDRVADKLAGAVIGDVAAAVDLVERDAARGQKLVRRQDICALGVAAQREHGRMLEQQKHVADAAFGAQRDQLLLQAQCLAVIHAPEIEVLDHPYLRL